MGGFSSVKVTDWLQVDVEQVQVRLREIPPGMHITLLREERKAEEMVLERARDLAATVLQVRTGRFVASIQGEVVDDPDQVMARVWSGDQKAHILEYGAQVPAHDEHPNDVKALLLQVSSGQVFAASVHHPADVIKPHPTIHEAYDELLPEIVHMVLDGVGDLVNQTDI